MYKLTFISQEDFEHHVAETVKLYDNVLKSMDLKTFNSNIVDPVKLLFDKYLFQKSFEDIVELEIHRQRDKSNNNGIGYFHQNMFKYIKNCTVPKTGWDIVYDKEYKPVIYVEMKNKHNTMNSSSAKSTYIKMQNQILKTPQNLCYLVEIIAKKSQNIPWKITIDGEKMQHENIRRVSIDVFYKEITGVENAFYLICEQLVRTLDKMIEENRIRTAEKDTVLDELHDMNPDVLSALYKLAFKTYEGFEHL